MMRIESSDVARSFAPDASPAPARGFATALVDALERASDLQAAAAEKTQALAAGETDDIHGTMIAMKEAEIATKLVGSVRNKILDAFHELWRTNV